MSLPASIPFEWFTNTDFKLDLQFGLDSYSDEPVLQGDIDIENPINLTGYTIKVVVFDPDAPDTVYTILTNSGMSPRVTITDAATGSIEILLPAATILTLSATFLTAAAQCFLIPPSGSPTRDDLWFTSKVTVSVEPPLS